MYRCTECHTEYIECPDYCECGNDTFEEVIEEEYYEDDALDTYEEEEEYVPEKRKLSRAEIEEMKEHEREKKKSIIAICISVLVTVIIIFSPPHMAKKMDAVKKQAEIANVKLPAVNTYWDDTVASPFRQKDPNWNLPILNKRLGKISPVLREYLVTIGSEFNRLWNPGLVDGKGECKVEFTINKEGGLNTKKIAVRSYNESLDDSVLLLLSKINSFDIPPDDYKGERIILAFKVDANKTSKVYYPMN